MKCPCLGNTKGYDQNKDGHSLSANRQASDLKKNELMKTTTVALLKTMILVLFLFSVLNNTNGQTPAATIPEFEFFTFEKLPFTNKNLSTGKKILFIFFDVTCEHCQQTIKSLNAHLKECKDISIYLLTLDEKPSVTNFFNTFGKDIPQAENIKVLHDTRNQFIRIFGPRKYPSVFLYAADRKLLLYSDEDQSLGKFLKLIKNQKK